MDHFVIRCKRCGRYGGLSTSDSFKAVFKCKNESCKHSFTIKDRLGVFVCSAKRLKSSYDIPAFVQELNKKTAK